MKHLIYVALLLGFGVVQATDISIAQDDTVFNPVEMKAEMCQQFEEIQKTLSCEGEDCPPLYESTVPYPLQLTASHMCSFECVVGERMCDETLTLNPDNDEVVSINVSSRSKCKDSDDVMIEKGMYFNGGIKHIEEIKIYTYSNEEGTNGQCKEGRTYVEICNADGGECREIEKHSEEWYEYERQKQLEAYEASCFVATESDCKDMKQDINQCVLDTVQQMSTLFCASSQKYFWYRKQGWKGSFFGYYKKPPVDSVYPTNERPRESVNVKMEKPTVAEDSNDE